MPQLGPSSMSPVGLAFLQLPDTRPEHQLPPRPHAVTRKALSSHLLCKTQKRVHFPKRGVGGGAADGAALSLIGQTGLTHFSLSQSQLQGDILAPMASPEVWVTQGVTVQG